MITKISFCGYFCPSDFSFSGRILGRLEFRTNIFMPLLPQANLLQKTVIIFKRSIAALLVILATTLDCLVFSAKGIYLLIIAAPTRRSSQINNLANIISSVALSILILTMPFGYLPETGYRNPNFESERLSLLIQSSWLVERIQERQKIRKETYFKELRVSNNYSGLLEMVCHVNDINFEIQEDYVHDVYRALMAGVDPDFRRTLDDRTPLAKVLDKRIFRIIAYPRSDENRQQELNRYTRIAKMLMYSGSRPKTEYQSNDICKQTLLEIEAETKEFTSQLIASSIDNELRVLPKGLLGMVGQYWTPPIEKFLAPNVA